MTASKRPRSSYRNVHVVVMGTANFPGYPTFEKEIHFGSACEFAPGLCHSGVWMAYEKPTKAQLVRIKRKSAARRKK